MKHSTFRKSSLISSIALLLVAIVALGGATFAWFSNKTTASAGTLEMTATSGSGLYIVESALNVTEAPATGWSSTVKWAELEGALPAVSGLATSESVFFKTATDNADGSWNDAKDDEGNYLYPINTAVANTDFVAKKIWVKADASGTQELSITVTVGGENKGYERVAIIDPDNNVTILDNAGEAYDALTSQTGGTSEVTPVTYDTGVTYSGDLSTAKAFKVLVWFEGQDAQCYNKNGSANLTLDLGFEI